MAEDVVDLEALEWRVRGAEGEWYERHAIGQDLAQLATDALVAGWDTQSLRVLAGEPPSARWLFIRYICWLVVTDQLRPLDGGKRLERIH